MTDDEDHAGSGVVFKGLMGAVFAIALIYWVVSVRGMSTLVVAQRQCEHAYRAARTASDTIATDSITVVGGQRDSSHTCGDLRRTGRLR